MFSSLSELLNDECSRRPVVVMCDDVQWCDESSVSAVNHVVRMNRRQPLLVIAASREVELRDNASVQQVLRSLRHDGLLEEVRLEPLSALHAQTLIEREVTGVDAALLGLGRVSSASSSPPSCMECSWPCPCARPPIATAPG